ncbi:ABC transporter ATP-binding protein [Nocardia seriolae]|uniref:ABC transporter n=1 Tax=Nocardia seriolae TaxID=37332 RepID=A0A0B8N9U7_9NOCA|nr:ABC transporter ATP-binding protein [Nocardia seriolae]APB01633.1 Iron import ATP-binding/permease protein IrtA [Nocardia seriolae]MTJ60893.1 ATP-binding cassette domain-containing protein [Nocardia seriolae]MTJ73951.1 ATP-binding cassette domain-containing protein [Nocardia seriolae]MTJ90970.1 ATP-binding cassette domain-containing protein [Nocardia seriolae]MTK34927.1 ATP-binding cassette domain-containing protein [Nocardia seriolae]
MTVESPPAVEANAIDPGPAAADGGGPDARADSKAEAKARRQREAAARKEILAPVGGALTIAGLITAVAALCSVLPFLLIVSACRELLRDSPDTDRVWRLLLIAVLVLVARAVLQATALTWSHAVDARYQLSLRRLLADKLTRVPLGWFGARSSSEVKKYLQDDVEALHYLVAHARLDFIGSVTVPLVTLVYLATVDWRLTLVLLLPLVIYALCMRAMLDEPGRERLSAYNAAEQRTRAATVEFVDGIQVVRAFGRAGKAHSEFRDAVEEQTERLRRMKMPVMTVQSISDTVVAPVFVMLLIVVAGLAGVGLDWLEPLDLLPFLLVGLGLGSSLLGLGYGAQALRTAGDAALRLHELQQTAELASGSGESEPVEAPAGLIRFEDVSFGYRADHKVLRGLDLELAPGTMTALVGPSGSGKSTLAKLLPRFYDVDSGRITIGGRDIRDIPSDELYRTVGFVFQDVRLIRGTIADNLRLARPDAAAADLERAARAARIHERILALPRGYDSEIGVDAILSGGEAQRLSIARTLLADTPVLVLDEATAFADPESEAAVQDALAELVAGRTVLVIAHRLHTITAVDRILVLENGTLVEQGDHATLHTAGGLYQRLWEINAAALNSIADAEGGADDRLGAVAAGVATEAGKEESR